jgi:hypothetical protein
MINILITLLIIVVVVGLIWWVLDYLPVPDPLNRIAKVVSMVIAIVFVIILLLRLAGVETVHLP